LKAKSVVALTAVLLIIGTAAMAKEKGTPVKFPNWGVITVPDDLYMEQGRQPMVTAQDYDNDMVSMLETIYPLEPETYQLVKKNDASFQYGYLLHYSASIWEVEAAIERQDKENSYLRDIGSRPELNTLVLHANEKMSTDLPRGFRVVKPLTAKKIKDRQFYEGTIARSLIINQNSFTELIRIIAWQHGNSVEIAVIMGNTADGNELPDSVAAMFENAEKMPKK
jgi:hypothetical protein